MKYIGDSRCGCPLYDMNPGIAKMHGKKCKEKPKGPAPVERGVRRAAASSSFKKGGDK